MDLHTLFGIAQSSRPEIVSHGRRPGDSPVGMKFVFPCPDDLIRLDHIGVEGGPEPPSQCHRGPKDRKAVYDELNLSMPATTINRRMP